MSTRRALVAFLAVATAIVLLPSVGPSLGLPPGYLTFGYFLSFWIAQSTSWNVLSGYTGYFSFGQAAFVGVGVYASAFLVVRLDWDYFVTIPVAAALGGLLGLLIGGLAFRLGSLRGEIFALLTLAVSFILASIVRLSPSLGAGQGLSLDVPEYPEILGDFSDMIFRLGALVAVIAVVAAYTTQHSRFGWGLSSIRDAEDVAEGIGVPTFRHKMLALSLSGALAGLAGSVFALQVGFVTVEQVFGVTLPISVIVMSVLGGRRHWAGPVVGASLIYLIQDRLAATGLDDWSRIILGGILVALILFAPEGLVAHVGARPGRSIGSFALVLLLLFLIRAPAEPLDRFAIAGLVGVAVALSPWPARPRRPAGGGDEPDTASGATATLPPLPDGPGHLAEPGRILECAGLTKSFGGVRALAGVSLHVDAGEIVGLVGPNGSGKSTLINVVSGLFPATAGEIRLDGVRLDRLPAHRRAHLGVTRTYQTPRPFETMTVRDNVAVALMFGREPSPLPRARAAAEGYLEFVGLADRADARPGEINLHERHLLELARALATQPRLLLLDEALAGLNPSEVEIAFTVIRAIHDAGITIVIVEHLIRVVTHLATRVIVLDEGAVLAEGSPHDVMRDPGVIAAYLGGGSRDA